MGRCTVCGKIYCSCPSDGICNDCATRMNAGYSSRPAVVVGSPCNTTAEDIARWKKRCECMLAQGVGIPLGISQAQVNTIYSYVMSAHNYRNTPCMFAQFIPQIESFMQLLDVNGLCNR